MEFRQREPKISAVVRGKAPATCMSYHEDGGFLFVSSSEDSKMRIIDCQRGSEKPALKFERDGIKLVQSTHHNQSILFSGGGKDITQNVGQKHALNYLSLHDNKILRQFRGHSGEITGISMSPVDDTFLTSSADGGVRLWNLQQAGSLASMDLPKGGVMVQNSAQKNLTMDPNGSPNAAFDCTGLVFGITAPLDANAGHIINLYDARNYSSGAFAEMEVDNTKVLNAIAARTSRPDVAADLVRGRWTSMRFNKSGKQILVTTEKGVVMMIDGYNGELTNLFLSSGTMSGSPMPQAVPTRTAACFSSDDRTVLCGNEDGTISCYDATSGELVRRLNGHVGNVGCIASNPKYQQFASSCTNTALWLW